MSNKHHHLSLCWVQIYHHLSYSFSHCIPQLESSTVSAALQLSLKLGLAPKHSQGFIISYLIVERLKEKQNCIFHSFKKNLPHFFHFQAFQKDRQNESMPEKEIFLHSHVSVPGKEWAPSSTALQRPLFSRHFLSYVYFCGINYHQIWSQGDT